MAEKICRDFEALGGGLLGSPSPMMSDPLGWTRQAADRICLVNEKFTTIRLHMFTNLIGLSRFSDDEVLLTFARCATSTSALAGSKQTAMPKCSALTNSMRFTQVCCGLGNLNRSIGSPCQLILNVRTYVVLPRLSNTRVWPALRNAGYCVMGIANEFSDFGGIVTQDHVPEGIKITKVDRSADRVPWF